MEDALYLSRLAATVTIINRRDAFRASRVMAGRVLETPNIRVEWNATVDDVFDVRKKEVTGVRLRDVRTGGTRDLAIDGLFIAIGHTPNTQPFRSAVACNEAGYIVADHCRTSAAGVFAAGDVQDAVYRQAVTAAGSGCMAALEVERYLAVKG